MEISPYKFNQPGGDPKPHYIHVTPCPDSYRGQYTDKVHSEEEMSDLYASEVDKIIDTLRYREKREVAGFIAESLQSCGGQIIPPKGYFQKVFKAVRDAGGVCIADEVQVGFGRVGSHYWAFETQDVVPDIVTVAKPMGNGHPVGAVITTQEIADSFSGTGVVYFNTYGGNPVSCAIANAVMRVIDEEKLQENALKVGKFLDAECKAMKKDFDIIGDVRGVGLFVGIELVLNRRTREPATEAARYVVNRMKNVHKILVSSDGPNDNVIKLKPPMVFTQENGEEFISGFKECLTQLEKERRSNTNTPLNVSLQSVGQTLIKGV